MLAGDVRRAEEVQTAMAGLAKAVLSLRPLAQAGPPLCIPAGGERPEPGRLIPASAAALIAGRLGVALRVCPDATAPGRFDPIVSAVLRPHLDAAALTTLTDADLAGLAAAADDALAGGFDAMRAPTDVVTGDGVRLRTYTTGDPARPAVVLASACGMPARLCEQWMRFLAADHHVVTWETRGLFGQLGDGADFDAVSHDLPAQAGDLLAVMDHHRLDTAHVMGLCGGAVIALTAAAARPERVSSMSLWHGDFSGTPGPTTGHQDNLKALMSMALQSRQDAAAINGALAQTALDAVPADVAHLVVYPYADDELFYRYCALTYATMTTDIGALLPGVRPPTLVVTSEDDHTAHPGGSHQVAAALPRARLLVEPHGDHISVFGAGARLKRLMTEFLAERTEVEEVHS